MTSLRVSDAEVAHVFLFTAIANLKIRVPVELGKSWWWNARFSVQSVNVLANHVLKEALLH
jgi:hypothetical protein